MIQALLNHPVVGRAQYEELHVTSHLSDVRRKPSLPGSAAKFRCQPTPRARGRIPNGQRRGGGEIAVLQWIARGAPAASLGAEAGRPARQAPGAAQRQAPNLPAHTCPNLSQTLSYLPQLGPVAVDVKAAAGEVLQDLGTGAHGHGL
jgi:hypothetical protein